MFNQAARPSGVTDQPYRYRLGRREWIRGLREELWGNQAASHSIAYRKRLKPNLWIIAGGTLGGNVREERSDITLRSLRFGARRGVQYDGPVDPIKLDFGIDETGLTRFYFSAALH